MALFPFSIADIDDPEHIRVVLYASGRTGHAPLNALLKQMHHDMKREDKNHTKNYAQLLKRVVALEEKLKAVFDDNGGSQTMMTLENNN